MGLNGCVSRRSARVQSLRFLAARQLDDGCPGGGHLAAMRRGVLADLHQVLALVDEFSGDDPVDENDVSVRVVAPDLTFALAQEAGIPHPVREMVREPRATLRAVVVRTGRADLEGECFVPVHPFGAVWNVEPILDPQSRVLCLHSPGKLIGTYIEAAPALRITDEPGYRHGAFDHLRQSLALANIFPIAGCRAADFFRLIHLVELG